MVALGGRLTTSFNLLPLPHPLAPSPSSSLCIGTSSSGSRSYPVQRRLESHFAFTCPHYSMWTTRRAPFLADTFTTHNSFRALRVTFPSRSVGSSRSLFFITYPKAFRLCSCLFLPLSGLQNLALDLALFFFLVYYSTLIGCICPLIAYLHMKSSSLRCRVQL